MKGREWEKQMVFLLGIIFFRSTNHWANTCNQVRRCWYFLLTSSIFCPKTVKLKLGAGALEFLRDIKAKWQFSWYENHLISQQLNIPVGRTIRQWVTKDILLQSLQIPFLCDISGIKIIIKGPEWYFSKALCLKFHICCFPGNDFHSFEITKLILFCFCFALFCFFPLYFYIF